MKINPIRRSMQIPLNTSLVKEASTPIRIACLCLFSAVLYGLASPRLNWHFLCWVLLIPLLDALDGASLRRGFFAGWLCGTLAHLVCFTWIIGTVQRYSNLDLTLSVLAWILFAAYSGLAFGLMTAVFLFLEEGNGLPKVILLPACYTAMEFLFPFVFPWHLGAGLYRVIPIIQISDLFGVYGITALVVSVNAALWDLTVFLRRRRSFPWFPLTTATGLIAVSLLYGFWRIAWVEQKQEGAPDLDVGLVQANVRIEERRSGALLDDIWHRYLRLSRDAAERGAEMIVWPESAVHFAYRPVSPDSSPSGSLRNFVRTLARPLLFGSWAIEPDGARNRAYLLGPDGGLLGQYDKVQLLAFGEYMPFSDWVPQLTGLVQGVGDFRPGRHVVPLCWDDNCFGVLICFEAILKPISRDFTNGGAAFLVNITNDAWFGDTSCPEQHLMLATFRAVENRVWMVRSANTGISAFIDPLGRIVKRTALFEQAVRVCRIDRMKTVTLYRKWGDWFPVASSILVGLLVAARVRKRLSRP